ncbi:tryptophan synthase subunit alpha [Streptomyces sp. NPDC048338]|uniref:tryptophan synthase subunit alpha n=1 Tax=Streptomyces sp. NPDC048338 TaxID=3365536 RepID=UPI003714883A
MPDPRNGRTFFPGRTPDDPGLALFLNAGDPGPDQTRELLLALDDSGVDCAELAVPFPDSPTDGPTIRRSAQRALTNGIDLDRTLGLIAGVRPSLRHTKIALLADWRHSIRGPGMEEFLRRARGAGADAVLPHGLPPLLKSRFLETAHRLCLPVVTTCYATSDEAVVQQSARQATAYLYLVARYGRSGSDAPLDHTALRRALDTARLHTDAPLAAGFGVRTAADVRGVGELGAHAAVIGTALVESVERALVEDRDVTEAALRYLSGLLRRPS